jgi:glycine cleavage system aminomethyltransferase T/glycine/D-amino acid oxidase-like deaminating enzyme
MKQQVRVVIIGGGIAGVSVLYHLARLGWSDALLLEQGRLADGTTWHSAGHCVIPYVSRQMTRFTRESIELFREFESSGLATGFVEMGSVTLATTPDRVEELRRLEGAARVEGIPYHLVDADEAQALWPLARTDDVLLAGHSPGTGRVDPYSATNAIAEAARRAGASVEHGVRVVALGREDAGGWLVETDRGAVSCEIVVDAAGQWARDIGMLAGHALPLVPLEHQYIVTAAIGAFSDAGLLPILRDADNGFYLRGDGDGALLGIYEDDVREWGIDGIPDGFLHKLLPGDLDRIAPWVERAEWRVPSLEGAGIRLILNGPDAYTPDDHFIMGPVPGDPTFFVFAGFNSAGVQTAPGAARYLAEWISEGEATIDLDDYDAARFGPHVDSLDYLVSGAKETYGRHYPVRYPIEERESGRPSRTSPLHEKLAARGAVFGERFGWERPVWFRRPGGSVIDQGSFRRPPWFERVDRECLAVREAVGIIDQTSFSKHIVSGPGAAEFLDAHVATALPRPGRVAYALELSARGGIETDLTITRLREDEFYVVGAAANEVRDRDRMIAAAPTDGSVVVRTVTTSWGVLTVAGPQAALLLEMASGGAVDDASHPFFSWRDIQIGRARARALRVSYSGELGWELHVPIEMVSVAYEALITAGRDLGITDVGYRALDSLGLEKGYGAIGADLDREHSPLEAGLGHLIRPDKGSFKGREAFVRQVESGVSQRRYCLLLDPEDDAMPYGMEPVTRHGETIGFTVRGGYGHRIGRAIAYAYLPTDIDTDAGDLTVGILGKESSVSVSTVAPYDPDDRRRVIGRG